MGTMEKQPSKITIRNLKILLMIEIQIKRAIAELRNQNIGEALRLLDEINKKLAEMIKNNQ